MSRVRTKHSRSGKSSLIQLPEGLPLSPSAHQAPAGVSADVAAAYSQLFLPLSVAASFLSIPKPPNPGADLLEPCAEALELARQQVEQFLRQEETRLRAEAPGVFEVANEILDYAKALVVELPINRAWIEGAIAANSPPEEVQDRITESRQRLAEKCRKHLGSGPVETLVSLVGRLRTAICQWGAAESKNKVKGKHSEGKAIESKRGAPVRNKARNAWIVSQRREGATLQAILAALQAECAKNQSWDPVSSVQAIHAICMKSESNLAIAAIHAKSDFKSNP